MPRQVSVLVDLDNVLRNPIYTDIDGQTALVDLAGDLGPRLALLFPGLLDAAVRLYGAWQWADETRMKVRTILSRACEEAASMRFGYPLLFELADRWESPRAPVNSYMQDATCRCRYKVGIREQKLVDTMLVCDLIHFSMYPGSGVVIVTDDHDIIPGLAQAAYLRAASVDDARRDDLVWLRPSKLAGRADRMLVGAARITDYSSTAGELSNE